MNILLTGGAGYIGSHAAVVLSEAGHEVVIFDNFSNSNESVITAIEKIIGKDLHCVKGDVRNTQLISEVINKYKIEAVIHFAGLKAVGDSVKDPIAYYSSNVQGAVSLLQAMQANNIKKIVFSSSATVYGTPKYLPYDEDHPTNPINPYGRTKLNVEEMLKDLSVSDSNWSVAILRYFNPVGAHSSGLICEMPIGIPNNLMPYLTQVASGRLSKLNVFGSDYDTRDGTGERDYIHVMDLVEGHLSALNYLHASTGFHIFNLGSGCPTTVLELVHTFEQVTNKKIHFELSDRRQGDLPSFYASALKAKSILGWEAQRSVAEMCSSAWAASVIQNKFK